MKGRICLQLWVISHRSVYWDFAHISACVAAHSGGAEPAERRRGDGGRGSRGESEVEAEGHWGGRNPPGFYPLQPRQPLPLRSHLRCTGNEFKSTSSGWGCRLVFLSQTRRFIHPVHWPCLFQIVIIEHKSIICPGYNAVLHIHTCIEEVQITVSYCFPGFFPLAVFAQPVLVFRVPSWPLWTAVYTF